MNSPEANLRGGGRVGVRDVARLAGVSTQTVSRVLNNSSSLREETRRRVLDAMAQLDYRPNNAARSLGTATTRTLGVVATDVTLYGPTLAIAALATAARDVGRWIATAYADATDASSLDTALTHVMGQGVDGIVLVAPHVRTRDALLARSWDMPIVIMNGGHGDRQAEASTMVVDHLVGLGHRRLSRIGGPADWLEEASRREGFEAAMNAHGLHTTDHWSGDWSAKSGFALADSVAAAVGSANGPSAVVVANDQMALGLTTGLTRLGIDVPGVVSVAGFDDNPDAEFYRPALTTVRLDLVGEARRCVAEVFDPDRPVTVGVPALVSRLSTGPPA